ncbi:protein NYNRIN-like [Heterodontus francisci]|uniref:protein NYNRIN-like n=1 Tax=Heterodontus francisci TaxID=7792 RepID=UPI00355C0689
MYVDGSASVSPDGQRLSGYAIVNQDSLVMESAAFQLTYSAQQAELFALIRACILGKGWRINIYTDSRYAFGVVHDFGQLWKNRGFLTSAGTKISHQKLVADLSQALLLPKQISVIKCTAHMSGKTPVDIGNRRADSEAKRASQTQHVVVEKMMNQTKRSDKSKSVSEKPMPTIQDVIRLQEDAPDADKQLWEKLGCKYDSVSCLWTTPANQTCMPDALALWVIECVHFATHCGAQGTSDLLLATGWHPKIQMLAQNIINRCLICLQHNTGKGIPCEWGKTPLPSSPFEMLQMDYIELERCQCYKYVLVIIDVFSKWIEAYPTTDNKAATVVQVLMREIIPRYGIPAQLSSDNGPHFIGQVNKEFCLQLGIRQQLHCA